MELAMLFGANLIFRCKWTVIQFLLKPPELWDVVSKYWYIITALTIEPQHYGEADSNATQCNVRVKIVICRWKDFVDKLATEARNTVLNLLSVISCSMDSEKLKLLEKNDETLSFNQAVLAKKSNAIEMEWRGWRKVC